MEIRVPCTHCGKVLLVKEGLTTRVGICPNCHRKVTIARQGTHDTPHKPSDTPAAAGVGEKSRNSPRVKNSPPPGRSIRSDSNDTKSIARSDSQPQAVDASGQE